MEKQGRALEAEGAAGPRKPDPKGVVQSEGGVKCKEGAQVQGGGSGTGKAGLEDWTRRQGLYPVSAPVTVFLFKPLWWPLLT